jgi:hypothetical protein
MEISIAHQQMEALISLAIGLGTGVFYDFLGIFRRRLKLRIFTYLFDLLFCLVLGCVFFLIGYGPGGGRLRLFMLFFLILGCVLYFLLFSKLFGGFLDLLADLVEWLIHCLLLPFVLIVRLLKKIREILKNIFHYLSKWFNIYNRVTIPLDKWRKAGKTREEAYCEDEEDGEGRHYYKDRHTDTDRVRHSVSDQSSCKNRRGRKGKNRADASGRG